MLKKSNLFVLLAVSTILASMACAPVQNGDRPTASAPTQSPSATFQSPSATPQARPGGSQTGLPQDVLKKVAETVGVDSQSLESAITQAMSQLTQPTPTTPVAGETSPTPPGTPGANPGPQGSAPGGNPAGLPSDVLKKAAETLGIDAQRLETAFTQAMSQFQKDVRETPQANPK